jgi:hypothetical protein
MENEFIQSWIFLASAYASEKAPAQKIEIIKFADGINKTPPSENEFETATKYLISNDYLNTNGTCYELSPKGLTLLRSFSSHLKSTPEVLKSLIEHFSVYKTKD